MPDNLTVSIGIDTKKLTADLNNIKAQIAKTQREINSEIQKVSKGGDPTRLNELSRQQAILREQAIATNRVLQQQNRALAGHGIAAAGAARGMNALSKAHVEAAESSKVNVREITKISKELGN